MQTYTSVKIVSPMTCMNFKRKLKLTFKVSKVLAWVVKKKLNLFESKQLGLMLDLEHKTSLVSNRKRAKSFSKQRNKMNY